MPNLTKEQRQKRELAKTRALKSQKKKEDWKVRNAKVRLIDEALAFSNYSPTSGTQVLTDLNQLKTQILGMSLNNHHLTSQDPLVTIKRRDTYLRFSQALTAEFIKSIKISTETGRMRDWIMLCQQLKLMDPDVVAAIQARKSRITSKKLEVVVKEQQKTSSLIESDSVKRAKEYFKNLLNQNLSSLNVELLEQHLLEAIFTGLAIAELFWKYDIQSNSYYIDHFNLTSAAKVSYDDCMELYVDDITSLDQNPESAGKKLKDFPNHFIIHEAKELDSYSNMDGLFRVLAMYIFLKQQAIIYSMAGLEKFAFPPIVAIVPNHTNAETGASMKAELEVFNSETITLVKEGTSFVPLTPPVTSGSSSWMEMIDWYNKEINKSILRGTMTLDDGSSRSQSEVHERGETELTVSDGRKLLKTLKEYVLLPFIRVNAHLLEEPETGFPICSVSEIYDSLDLVIPGLEASTQKEITRDWIGHGIFTKNMILAQMGFPLIDGPEGEERI